MPESSDEGERPLTANYLIKYVAPLLMVTITAVAWLIRLEAKVEQNDKSIDGLVIRMQDQNETSGALKLEQAKLNGQIETLKVMLSAVAETAKRIEDKLDKTK